MVTSIISVVFIIAIPVICVLISLFCSPTAVNNISQYQTTLIETSYLLLCIIPYKEILIDSRNCDHSEYNLHKKKPHTVTNEERLTTKHSEESKREEMTISSNLLHPYSEIDTFALGMLENENDQISKERGTKEHGFNLFTSDKIGLRRNIPDTRNDICKKKVYSKDLPTVSIVMCFYNEAWSTLLRSVHSILSHTPLELIKEIILLDDKSSFYYLKHPLDEYVKENLSNVKIIHSPVRLGLIRARMEGAKHATGEVLLFLDSHIEVGQNWLPPLLDRIAQNRKSVVIPVVDTIEGETMIYKKANLVRGGFTWSLLHNWEQLPVDILRQVETISDPFISPTMPGGLFAMEKNYFYELGEYDSGMDIWGGENMEISFRIWQCGGKLEIVPCSRIGHVFRQFRPYTSPDGQDTATRNAARVAHVWLDDYKKHFYDLRPTAKTMNYGDVSDRIALRKKLGCKSFQWFLENIHPEQIVPGEKAKVPGAYFRRVQRPIPTILAEGYLKHQMSGLCAVPEKKPPTKGTAVSLAKCQLLKDEFEKFSLGDDYQLKLSNLNLCVESKGKQDEVFLMKCAPGGFQTWIQIDQNGHQVLYNPPSGKCLAVTKPQEGQQLSLDFCTKPSSQTFLIK